MLALPFLLFSKAESSACGNIVDISREICKQCSLAFIVSHSFSISSYSTTLFLLADTALLRTVMMLDSLMTQNGMPTVTGTHFSSVHCLLSLMGSSTSEPLHRWLVGETMPVYNLLLFCV